MGNGASVKKGKTPNNEVNDASHLNRYAMSEIAHTLILKLN